MATAQSSGGAEARSRMNGHNRHDGRRRAKEDEVPFPPAPDAAGELIDMLVAQVHAQARIIDLHRELDTLERERRERGGRLAPLLEDWRAVGGGR